MPGRTDGLHHLRIADADTMAVDRGAHAVAGDLLDRLDTAVVRLMRVRRAQRDGDRVRRVALDM